MIPISSRLFRFQRENLSIYKFPLLSSKKGLIHGISTRQGGISQGPYRSLNLSFNVGDTSKNVRENRRRLAQSLNVKQGRFTLAEQVHKAEVAILEEADAGRGAYGQASAIPGADVLITNVHGPALLLLGADCPLILLYDEATPVVALIHASWRGLLGGIILKSLRACDEAFGSRPENISAAISPSIGPCCYEVGEDFLQAWEKSIFFASNFLTRRQGRLFFDLWQASETQLLSFGLLPQNIYNPKVCTACNYEEFYSYRHSGGTTGRFGLLAALSECENA